MKPIRVLRTPIADPEGGDVVHLTADAGAVLAIALDACDERGTFYVSQLCTSPVASSQMPATRRKAALAELMAAGLIRTGPKRGYAVVGHGHVDLEIEEVQP